MSPFIDGETIHVDIVTDEGTTTSSTLKGAENMGDDGGDVNWIKNLDIFRQP